MPDNQICLDKTDWCIIKALEENARSTFTEIGQTVGLTAPAVRERIRRMEENGLICGYRPVINYSALGRPIHALIELKLKSGSKAALRSEFSFLPHLKEIPGITHSWLVTGDNEGFIETTTATMKQLDAILVKMNELGFLTVTSMVLEDSGKVKCEPL